MEDLIQVLVNNGLGVASFLALIYFYNSYVNRIAITNEEINKTNQKICTTLESVEKNLSDLSARVEKIESKNKNDKF